jgi:hypothetical protein
MARRRFSKADDARTTTIVHHEDTSGPARSVRDWKPLRVGAGTNDSERLRVLNTRAAGLRWKPTLLKALLEELHVDDSFEGLVGRPARLSVEQYPQAAETTMCIQRALPLA